jgi:hypothetical protein
MDLPNRPGFIESVELHATASASPTTFSSVRIIHAEIQLFCLQHSGLAGHIGLHEREHATHCQ